MKITKTQLKEIIKEELLKLQEYGGRPYDPTVAGDFERARDNITGDAPPGPRLDLGPPPAGRRPISDPGDEPDAGPTGKVHTVKLLLGGEYDDRITIKNAEEVTSPNPETLIIDHIEIDLQFGLKVLNITEGL